MKPPMNRSESVEVGKEEWDVAVVDNIAPSVDRIVSEKIMGDVIALNSMTRGMGVILNSRTLENDSSDSAINYNTAVSSDSSYTSEENVVGEQFCDSDIKDTDTGFNSASSLSIITIDELRDNPDSSSSYSLKQHDIQTVESEINTAIDPNLQSKGSLFTQINKNTFKNDLTSHSTMSYSPSHKPIKPGRQIFRWNLLFNLLVWIIISLPIWLPFVSNFLSIFILPGIQSVFVVMWMVICCLASRNMFKIFRFKKNSIDSDTESPIHHLFVISCYKEPVDLIARSVQTIANQKDVHNITMTISFEEKTPDLSRKTRKLRKIFSNAGFARLLFALHPYGQANEIPGKCSNANNGFRESVTILQREMGNNFNPENILVTTCDADSQFPTNYTAALSQNFTKCQNKNATIFQAPLFYNWGLDGASFVTRVTGLIRSTLMMGALIPFNINSMSIFSFSLRLCIDGNYVHPAYQMDDIICLIRWMGVTRRRIHICALPVPVISGPTSGSTVEIDVIEWARQARRWTIGAAEVFHYFSVKFSRMPKLPALSWGLSFLIYYGILLCSGSLYSLSMSLSMTFLVDTSTIPDYVQYWMYGLAACQQLCFLVVFILDVFATKALDVKECICLARNILHWILTPFVLLAYSLVEFYALHEIAIRGKKVCKHGASNKDALKA